jgi:hypothetical protein
VVGLVVGCCHGDHEEGSGGGGLERGMLLVSLIDTHRSRVYIYRIESIIV